MHSSAKSSAADSARAARHIVRLPATGESFRCAEHQHLLQGMQSFQIGVPMLKSIPVGCRGGGCGVCRIRVVDGEYETGRMSRKHVTEQEEAAGVALACRVFPRGPLAIEVLPALPQDPQGRQEQLGQQRQQNKQTQ